MSWRTRLCLLIPALACVLLSACVDTNALRRDIRMARMKRLNLWKLEAADQSKERLLLKDGDKPANLAMDKAIEIALLHNTTLQLALEEKTRADALEQEAWSDTLPSATVGASYVREDRQGRSASGKVGNRNNYTFSASVTQPLYRGGGTVANIRLSQIRKALVDEQIRGTVQQLIFDVRRAYLNARVAFELRKVKEQSVLVAKRQLSDVEKFREAGVAADFDVLRAKVQLQNFEADKAKTDNLYNRTLTALLRIMNVSQESYVTLVDEMKFVPDFDPAMGDSVAKAFLQRPELFQDELSVRIGEEAYKAAKAGHYPTVDAFFTGIYAQPDPAAPSSGRNDFGEDWETGIELTYTIFQGYAVVARVRQAAVDLRKSRLQLKDTEEQVLQEIRDAILSIEDARRFVLSQMQNRNQAKEALRLVELGQRQGIRKQVEVLDAQTALDEAEANYAEALFGHEVARLGYEKAIGALDPVKGMRLPKPLPE
jgi:outer membrane protein